MIDIIRIPTKFQKSIERLSDSDKAYILSGIFSLSIDEDFKVRDDGIGDLLELMHFENMKMWEKAMARKWTSSLETKTPKEATKEEEKKKPAEKPKKPKEAPKEDTPKEGEEVYDTFNLYNDYLEAKQTPEDERTATEVVLICFYDLGYKAEPNETLDTFRDWLIGISKLKNKTHEEMKEIAISWYTYWKAKGEKIDNMKTCFLGHYWFKNDK